MDVLRTPDERFESLPGWAHPPAWTHVDVDGTELRLARVEVGPSDGHPVVLLHGEPTWGYLYREVVGPLASAACGASSPITRGSAAATSPTSSGGSPTTGSSRASTPTWPPSTCRR
jgi:haloalkane dehalogenase